MGLCLFKFKENGNSNTIYDFLAFINKIILK